VRVDRFVERRTHFLQTRYEVGALLLVGSRVCHAVAHERGRACTCTWTN